MATTGTTTTTTTKKTNPLKLVNQVASVLCVISLVAGLFGIKHMRNKRPGGEKINVDGTITKVISSERGSYSTQATFGSPTITVRYTVSIVEVTYTIGTNSYTKQLTLRDNDTPEREGAAAQEGTLVQFQVYEQEPDNPFNSYTSYKVNPKLAAPYMYVAIAGACGTIVSVISYI